ncbi:NAD(P)/FAD-dependent oxidoreductase [Marinobacter nanhaiticus D15-8W]|uniref:NAD(P)/FAD-dependent oxidoreductase n=1 Tax=Marinobacter nanhaiticus D15-8W TaxID=626887 RepID=N6VXT4_9GAMM|nr:NAD(P)/FAD-dependent oxidoreductase [Marinobacter nanhaiticus]ENO15090.1 NAD(P)/FAD-dependent oxidoreductase [Marinobacter nanhaiticus D15-8W]BES69212.1 NAD(P)/FAD-dependent oxidoreductase [Marinobacter nanhaiticus D15-8W]
METLHHIVVVGGGAGGLELVTRLGNKLGKKKKARITLVDSGLTHVWKPLLHEVASGSLDASANEINYRAHARKHHYEFQLGRMGGLDRDKRQIVIDAFHDEEGQEVVPARHITYDTLVIAVGSTANDFGTPGAQEHCLFLDSLRQARRFHNLMLNAFLRKNHEAQEGRPHTLPITIIGAGATGVELAAELRLASRELPVYGMNHLRPEDVSITIIEAADRILPALPTRLSKGATRELERLNVKVLTGDPVREIRPQSLVIDGTEIPSEMTIWAAGIKAPAFLAELDGLETNRGNQLVVKQTLQTTNDVNIFALGDCAACPQPDSDRPVPPRAQAAHQQADALFETLVNRLQGKDAVAFVYNDHGSLINFSRYTTVGNLMGNLSGRSMYIEGKVARLFYISLYRMHQVALHGLLRTGVIWLMDRISRAMHPRLKLH